MADLPDFRNSIIEHPSLTFDHEPSEPLNEKSTKHLAIHIMKCQILWQHSNISAIGSELALLNTF